MSENASFHAQNIGFLSSGTARPISCAAASLGICMRFGISRRISLVQSFFWSSFELPYSHPPTLMSVIATI